MAEIPEAVKAEGVSRSVTAPILHKPRYPTYRGFSLPIH